MVQLNSVTSLYSNAYKCNYHGIQLHFDILFQKVVKINNSTETKIKIYVSHI